MNDKNSVLFEKLLNADEKQFAEALLEELHTINNGEKLTELAILASIKDLTAEKCDIINKESGAEALKNAELFRRISNVFLPAGEKKIAALRKVFIELSEDIKIIILKLYERLVRLKLMYRTQNENLPTLARECLDLYAPIAQRLGIRQVYNQMEDIAFKVLYPEDFARLDAAIEKRRPDFEAKLRRMSDVINTQMEKNGISCDIQYRVKRPYSIFRKLVNQNTSIDRIFDLMALRIITEKVDDCYLALGIVLRNWIPIENRFRDWVFFFKPNGYRSIQTTIVTKPGDKFEIQIRTAEMHYEAEYGTAAHWAYKEKTNTTADRISKLKEFLENDEYFNNPEALDELLNADSKRNFIHILTPKGEVKTIPEGSTILDFANSIHTDVFLTCTGGRINGKFAKIKTQLHSGDIVEILTNKNSKPSRDWLKILKSPSAKNKLVQWLKKNEAGEILADGKRLWEHFKKTKRHKLLGNDDETEFKENLPKVGFKSSDDFFSAIGTGSVKLSETLLRKLYPSAFIKKVETESTGNVSKSGNRIEVIVEGMNNIDTKLAKCCNPIIGEPIVAYVTYKQGIKIHSADCPIVLETKNKDKIRAARWAGNASIQSAKVIIFGEDYSKLLLASAEIAQSEKISITSTNRLEKNSDLCCLELTIEVKNIDQLRLFKKKLQSSAAVRNVK